MFFKSESERRKNKSISILKREKVPFINHLPVIEKEEEITLRTKEEICNRDRDSFISDAGVRSKSEILDQTDLHFRFVYFGPCLRRSKARFSAQDKSYLGLRTS